MLAKSAPFIYQLKVTLLETQPPIWRRIQVPSTMLSCCLHDTFQAVLGGKFWGNPETDEFGGLDLTDESKVTVAKVLEAEGDSAIYV
jgi:hypothetical protein